MHWHLSFSVLELLSIEDDLLEFFLPLIVSSSDIRSRITISADTRILGLLSDFRGISSKSLTRKSGLLWGVSSRFLTPKSELLPTILRRCVSLMLQALTRSDFFASRRCLRYLTWTWCGQAWWIRTVHKEVKLVTGSMGKSNLFLLRSV
jgi:hypothetical protein